MIERELKFNFDKNKVQELISRLKAEGFANLGRKHELTVMYDNPQKLMQKTDGRVRLRKSGEEVELCYKKPITREGIKQEIEHQVKTSSFEETEKILEMLEFTKTTSYERFRTKLKKGSVEVDVDEFPFACFIEIEGSEEDIKNLAKKLNLSLKDNLTDSCDTLFLKWRKEKGLSEDVKDLTFEGYDK